MDSVWLDYTYIVTHKDENGNPTGGLIIPDDLAEEIVREFRIEDGLLTRKIIIEREENGNNTKN